MLIFYSFDRLALVAISINGRDEVVTMAKGRERERMLIVQRGGMKRQNYVAKERVDAVDVVGERSVGRIVGRCRPR